MKSPRWWNHVENRIQQDQRPDETGRRQLRTLLLGGEEKNPREGAVILTDARDKAAQRLGN